MKCAICGTVEELPTGDCRFCEEVEAAAKVLMYGQDIKDEQDEDYWRYKVREALIAAKGVHDGS
jgi:hypothetical protein